MPIQIQYGTALVLLVFVLTMNLIATFIRSRARKGKTAMAKTRSSSKTSRSNIRMEPSRCAASASTSAKRR
jgi:hypothetical protein